MTMTLIFITMTLFSVTMTHIFELSVFVMCFGAKSGEFEPLNFGICVANFDTMKLFSLTKVPKTLVPSHFQQKEKEHRHYINTCVPIRCG